MGVFLLDYCFKELNLNRIIASCDTRNIASYRLMEKLGMKREKNLFAVRQPLKSAPDIYPDEYIYSKLKE